MAGTHYVMTSLGSRGFGRLGALPPFPTSGLRAGYEWVRYLVSADRQWASCPPNAP